LLVFPKKVYARENTTLEKKIEKVSEKKEKELWYLGNKPFACRPDALEVAKVFVKKLCYHSLNYPVEKKLHYGKKGRPKTTTEPFGERWYISGELEKELKAIERKRAFKGVFIIASNETDIKKLSAAQLLEVYKAQGTSVEKGFRFLNDPMFFTERKLRDALKAQGQMITTRASNAWIKRCGIWVVA